MVSKKRFKPSARVWTRRVRSATARPARYWLLAVWSKVSSPAIASHAAAWATRITPRWLRYPEISSLKSRTPLPTRRLRSRRWVQSGCRAFGWPNPRLGETFLVLGLGILGQMCVQMLRANGCRVLGTDLDASQVELAAQHGATGLKPGTDIVQRCLDLTAGRGVDGVIVCAGTSSNQPIELCGQVTREKGRVVVVGAVRMDIPREDYFKKEISVVISRSYGPGRYDPFYEEAGNDYPYGYVRFTEQRNMESVLGLIDQGQLELDRLITHRFDVDQAGGRIPVDSRREDRALHRYCSHLW